MGINVLQATLGTDKLLVFDQIPEINEGENLSTTIQISIPQGWESYRFYLEFYCPDGKKFLTPQLPVANQKISYDFENSILKRSGRVYAQISAYDPQDQRILFKSVKSNSASFPVNRSINGTTATYQSADFLAQAEKALQQATDAAAQAAAKGDAAQNVAQTLLQQKENGLFDGATPQIGTNGTWWINGEDTHLPSRGEAGTPGADGNSGATFLPQVGEDGTLSWTNDRGLANPVAVNLKGTRGEKGEKGDRGEKGEAGPVYVPTVSEAGVLSWSNEGGLENPASVNLKGEKGDRGETGAQGEKGAAGSTPRIGENLHWWVDGTDTGISANGVKGNPGAAGQDGVTYTPQVGEDGTLSWTNDGNRANPAPVNLKGAKGDKGEPGSPGEKGEQGAAGANGKNGATFLPNVDESGVLSWSNDGNLENPSPRNLKGDRGEKGDKGDTGAKGETGEPGPNVLSAQTAVSDLSEGALLCVSGGKVAEAAQKTKVSELTNDAGYLSAVPAASPSTCGGWYCKVDETTSTLYLSAAPLA